MSKCLITKTRMDAETETLIPIIGGHFSYEPIAIAENTIGRKPENGGNGDGYTEGGPMYTLNATGVHGVAQPIPIDSMNHISRPDHHSMGDFESGAAMYTLTKQHHHAVAQPIAFSGQMSVPQTDVDMTPMLQAKNPTAVAVGFDSYNLCETGDVNQTLKSPSGGVTESIGAVMQAMAVRRLTPTECERLQGFPDGYTDIKHNGKPTPDGPRYKALGNSMAVPVMAWIGKRIQEVEAIHAP